MLLGNFRVFFGAPRYLLGVVGHFPGRAEEQDPRGLGEQDPLVGGLDAACDLVPGVWGGITGDLGGFERLRGDLGGFEGEIGRFEGVWGESESIWGDLRGSEKVWEI